MVSLKTDNEIDNYANHLQWWDDNYEHASPISIYDADLFLAKLAIKISASETLPPFNAARRAAEIERAGIKNKRALRKLETENRGIFERDCQ